MSSVQFDNTYAEDERWIDAGPDAFALHFAACCYADRRNTDGLIPKVMVDRIALAVRPDQVPAALAALLDAGFWRPAGKNYQIINYVEDKIGLSAEEKLETRAKWAEDKRWRRRHNAGNHSACPPDKCRNAAKMSQSDSGETLAGIHAESSNTTRHDSTLPVPSRLDYGVGERVRVGRGPAGPALASAGATAAASPDVPDDDGEELFAWETDPARRARLLARHADLWDDDDGADR
jgi:hypothetical protein